MSDTKYLFQCCQKLIVFSADWQKVLLARRYGEADYDGTFSFIGGKMETTDTDLLAALKREKDEEIGKQAKIQVYPGATRNALFTKNDGHIMILPHYLARYTGGAIHLNAEEYSEYKWVMVAELENLEPKIENIPDFVAWALGLKDHTDSAEFIYL